jgi:3-oxoacyl-[acyl-carrier protein] reductase
MDISLKNKTALICGSTQGIGRAIAETMAGMGAHCVLMARNEEKLKEMVSTLEQSQGRRHQYVVADFKDAQQVKLAAEGLIAETPVHILINNTGGPRPGWMKDTDPAQLADAFQQHIINYHQLALACLPAMQEAGYGRIVNIVSTSVRIPIHRLGVSNTIRAATAAWAKTLANEWGPFNITVNNILPGYTETARLEALVENNARMQQTSVENVKAQMTGNIPLRRFGKPGEIAAVAAFLASPAASYVNGVSIPVDGGSTGSI